MPHPDHDPRDRRYQRRRPCSDCPFRRDCPPGIGNPDPRAYVGQAHGPFLLSCHQDPDYDSSLGGQPQIAHCAGAAIFRANLGIQDQLPASLHRLPPGDPVVFADVAELIAHHREIPIEKARRLLESDPPEAMLQDEIRKVRPDMILFQRSP